MSEQVLRRWIEGGLGQALLPTSALQSPVPVSPRPFCEDGQSPAVYLLSSSRDFMLVFSCKSKLISNVLSGLHSRLPNAPRASLLLADPELDSSGWHMPPCSQWPWSRPGRHLRSALARDGGHRVNETTCPCLVPVWKRHSMEHWFPGQKGLLCDTGVRVLSSVGCRPGATQCNRLSEWWLLV